MEQGATHVHLSVALDLVDLKVCKVVKENLVKEDPDVIVLGDAIWGGVTPEAVSSRAGWEGLTAVKTGKVFPFDDNLVSRPGPRLVDGLEALAKAIHPELYK